MINALMRVLRNSRLICKEVSRGAPGRVTTTGRMNPSGSDWALEKMNDAHDAPSS
jgi:hypothetical protein